MKRLIVIAMLTLVSGCATTLKEGWKMRDGFNKPTTQDGLNQHHAECVLATRGGHDDNAYYACMYTKGYIHWVGHSE